MKIPRDVSAQALIKVLSIFGYEVVRQKGSHIRLTIIAGNEHKHITIPNHNPLKLGTLLSILNEVTNQTGVARDQLLEKL